MAWQSPSAHSPQDNNGQGGQGQVGGNNGLGGPGGQVAGNAPQVVGTEYTLQGVMRFLQTEWHRHERDRNSWEIERAEMKARIAKLEGENRASKRLQQGSEARIKMLEMALKRERLNKQGKQSIDESTTASEMVPQKPNPLTNPLLNNPNLTNPYKADEARNRSRMYLEKCLQEITYLLTPPSHPPPQQQNVNVDPNVFPQQQQQQPHQMPLDHMLSQQLQQQHAQASTGSNHQSQQQMNEHQMQSQPQGVQSAFDARSRRFFSQSREEERIHQNQNHVQPGLHGDTSEQGSEKQQHQYNSVGRVQAGQDQGVSNLFSSSTEDAPKDSDGWDFDDLSEVPSFNKPSPNEEPWSSRNYSSVKSGNLRIGSRGRKNSMSRRMSAQEAREYAGSISGSKGGDAGNFKVRFALRGHLDVVRAVVFTGGGTPAEPEICTAGDDGVLKRWYLPGIFGIHAGVDVDVPSHFTHRGHSGIVTCLAASPPADGTSGNGDGWIFSGGQDSTIKVWERGRVEAKATLIGHTDAVWSICVLPTSGDGGFERQLLVSGAADGTVKIWSFSPRPSSTTSAPTSAANSIRGASYLHTGGDLAKAYGNTYNTNNISFNYSLLTSITRPELNISPTCIAPLSITGETFIVSYNDASIIIYDTASGEEICTMASGETYDGTPATGVNAVVATTLSLGQGIHSSASGAAGDGKGGSPGAGVEEESVLPGATGLKGGVYGTVISGHEDRYIRFYDANSGQCTYNMLAHPAAISSLALSPDGRELVSGGHDASLRFWSMEKRTCIKEMTTHRLMRGEGVCTVIWSTDGRWVVSGGGDGVVKVYSR